MINILSPKRICSFMIVFENFIFLFGCSLAWAIPWTGTFLLKFLQTVAYLKILHVAGGTRYCLLKDPLESVLIDDGDINGMTY